MNEEEQKYFKGLIGFTFDSDDIRYIEKIVDKKDKEIERLRTLLNAKENIVKEVREKVHDIYFRIDNIPQNHWIGIKLDTTNQGQELLEIIDKENDK